MKPWLAPALLVASLSFLWPSVSAGAEEAQYRAVTLVDGTLYRGVVVSADAENLVLRTLDGERVLSLMDIVQVDELEREAYLTAENRRWIFLGIEAPESARLRVAPLERALLELLQRPDLLISTPQQLNVRLQQQLESCPNTDCRLTSLREEGVPVVYGVLRGKGKQEQVSLRRLDRSLNQVQEVAIPVLDPKADRQRLLTSVALLLGEKPPAPEAKPAPAADPRSTDVAGTQNTGAASSDPKKQPPDQTTPAKNGSEVAAELSKSPVKSEGTPGDASAQAPESTQTAEQRSQRQAALKLDLLPVPGASSLLLYKDPLATAGAAAVVGVLTGAAVYVTGDMRVLGLPDGLEVNWTYPERGPRDALLLGGVGAATYLVSTLLVNQVVRVVQVQLRGH